jgi:hypothetical protein
VKFLKPETHSFQTDNLIKNELESIKTLLSLKSQITDFQVIINLACSKLLIEKEIELVTKKIQDYTKQNQIYWDGNGNSILLELI